MVVEVPQNRRVVLHMKRLMILGTTHSQVPLIQAAKDLGYRTIATGIKGNYPGIAIADDVCYMDVKDKEGVLEAAQKYKIDGITSCCMDIGLKSVGYVCNKMGLYGLSESVANVSTNKYHMKCALVRYGVNTARFYKVTNLDQLEDISKKLNFPLVVKAVDLASCKGIYVVRTINDLYIAYKGAMEITQKNYCIVEEFIEGEELGAEAFVYNNEVLFVVPNGKSVYMHNAPAPIGHYVPLNIKSESIEQIKIQVELAIKAIGLNNCAVNVDIILKEDKPYIIELTGRAGGTLLPELVSTYYSIDYYKMIAMTAVGEDPNKEFAKRKGDCTAFASKYIIPNSEGIIEDIINHNNNCEDDGNVSTEYYYNIESEFKRKEGDTVTPVGSVIVRGGTVEQCLSKVEEVISRIEIIIR